MDSDDETDEHEPLVLTDADLRQGVASSEIEAIWIAEVERAEAERDAYAEAASTLLRIYDLHIDQRLQGRPQNVAMIDPIRLILGLPPCSLGRTRDEFNAAKAEFEVIRADQSGSDIGGSDG